MRFGRLANETFKLRDQGVVVIDQRQVRLDVLPHAGVGEAVGHVEFRPVARVAEFLREWPEVCLTVEILDMRQQFGSLAHQVIAATQKVTR